MSDPYEPKARGIERETAILNWLYRWEFSAPFIIDYIANPEKKVRTPRSLISRGILEEMVSEPTGDGAKPNRLIGIASYGLKRYETTVPSPDFLLQYQGLAIVSDCCIRHDITVQRLVLSKLSQNEVFDFLSPLELIQESRPRVRHPDACLITLDGKRVAVELELVTEGPHQMDSLALEIIDALNKGAYDSFLIVCSSEAACAAYSKRFEANSEVFYWVKDCMGRYVKDQSHVVPDWVSSRVYFEKIDKLSGKELIIESYEPAPRS